MTPSPVERLARPSVTRQNRKEATAGPPPAAGQHLPCWHANPTPGAPRPPQTQTGQRCSYTLGRCRARAPAPCPQHTRGGAGSQPEQSHGRPDPDPGVCSSRQESQRPPHTRPIPFCSLCLPCSPRPRCRADGLRPVRFRSERGEPGRVTAAAASAQQTCGRRETRPSRPDVDNGPAGEWTPQAAVPSSCNGAILPDLPQPPAERLDRSQGWGPSGRRGTQDSSLLRERALLPLLGPGARERGEGRQGGRTMWPSPLYRVD